MAFVDVLSRKVFANATQRAMAEEAPNLMFVV